MCWECVHDVFEGCACVAVAGPGVEPEEVWQPVGTSCGAPQVRWDAERQAAPPLPPTQ